MGHTGNRSLMIYVKITIHLRFASGHKFNQFKERLEIEKYDVRFDRHHATVILRNTIEAMNKFKNWISYQDVYVSNWNVRN